MSSKTIYSPILLTFIKSNLLISAFRNSPKMNEFLSMIRQHSNIDTSKYSLNVMKWMILNDSETAPLCKTCGNEILEMTLQKDGNFQHAKYCCQKCYKADPSVHKLISQIKTKLYNDEEWKLKTEAKKIETNMKNLGVAHPMQNIDSFEKQKKSSFQAKVNNDGYLIQGYEQYALDFLKMFEHTVINGSQYLKENNLKLFWYDEKNKKHAAFPDFYVNEYAGFLEVKGEYTRVKDDYKIRQIAKTCRELNLSYYVMTIKPKKYYSYECLYSNGLETD